MKKVFINLSVIQDYLKKLKTKENALRKIRKLYEEQLQRLSAEKSLMEFELGIHQNDPKIQTEQNDEQILKNAQEFIGNFDVKNEKNNQNLENLNDFFREIEQEIEMMDNQMNSENENEKNPKEMTIESNGKNFNKKEDEKKKN